jgi:hypothetical protein
MNFHSKQIFYASEMTKAISTPLCDTIKNKESWVEGNMQSKLNMPTVWQHSGTETPRLLLHVRNQLTVRNFFRSLPDAISRRTEKAQLISILSAAAICRTGSSGMRTSGMCGGDLRPKKKRY